MNLAVEGLGRITDIEMEMVLEIGKNMGPRIWAAIMARNGMRTASPSLSR